MDVVLVGSSSPPPEAAGAVRVADGLNRVGLGYGIAIAVGILVLVSTIMLASYVCVKLHGRGPGPEDPAALRRRRQLLLQHSLEEIIASQDHNPGSAPPPQGLDEATLQSYPKVVYNHKKATEKEKAPPPVSGMMESGCCSICLADYGDGDVLRVLPDCGHGFHVACIDSWLRLQASCPMCRSSPLPTPVSTPLSELIPLARNPLVNVRYTIQNIL